MEIGLTSVKKVLVGLFRRVGGEESSRVSRKDYEARLEREVDFFKSYENVHDLPQIFHYWSNKYLVPKLHSFGFNNPKEFFALYMTRVCKRFPNETCRFVSIGAGNCDLDVEICETLLQSNIKNFVSECLDINEDMLNRGKTLASAKGLAERMIFSKSDINSWRPVGQYHIVVAIQCLHHFLELEKLFAKIKEALHPDGYFVTHDMIGRNGHMRWPEALELVTELWKELPTKYKYNCLLKRVQLEYENWDCSTEGFEGVRSQDILPLLTKSFGFDFFFAFGNVVDIFVDRGFGHNFDPNNEWDREFIDRVHRLDETKIEAGVIKPTQMMAAMTKSLSTKTTAYKHLTPQFCTRWPV